MAVSPSMSISLPLTFKTYPSDLPWKPSSTGRIRCHLSFCTLGRIRHALGLGLCILYLISKTIEPCQQMAQRTTIATRFFLGHLRHAQLQIRRCCPDSIAAAADAKRRCAPPLRRPDRSRRHLLLQESAKDAHQRRRRAEACHSRQPRFGT